MANQVRSYDLNTHYMDEYENYNNLKNWLSNVIYYLLNHIMESLPDHNIPTKDREKGIIDPISKLQVDTLGRNCDSFQIKEFKMENPNQGIVHVSGPEQGLTLPGMTIVCGDSHTSTHGALGALAFGIGTSEVEHVLATQCLIQKKSKNISFIDNHNNLR